MREAIRRAAEGLGIIIPEHLSGDLTTMDLKDFETAARKAIERACVIQIACGYEQTKPADPRMFMSGPYPLKLAMTELTPEDRKELLVQAWSISWATADVYAGGTQYRHHPAAADEAPVCDDLIDENLPTMTQLVSKYLGEGVFNSQPAYHEWLMKKHSYHPAAYWMHFQHHHACEDSYGRFVERILGGDCAQDWPYLREAQRNGTHFFARCRPEKILRKV